MKKDQHTVVSIMHYVRLLLRSAIFIVLLVLYILNRTRGGEDIEQIIEGRPAILVAIWLVFVVEMALRFFPSKLESPGCQKQFSHNYVKTGTMGDHFFPPSRTFFGKHQRIHGMPKLLRETLSSQETAQQIMEGLCRRVQKTRPLAVKEMMSLLHSKVSKMPESELG